MLRDATDDSPSLLVQAVAHELRSPLLVIRAYARGLLAQGIDTESEDVLRRIEASARQAEALIEDLKSLAGAGHAALAIRAVDIDAGDFLTALLPDLRAVAPGRDILLEVARGGGRLLADPCRLREIVTNLVENAGRYSTPGEPITIRACAGLKTTLTVEDRGPGVAEQDIEHIFAPYHRAAGAPLPGTGLGLAICRVLATAQGGNIRAERRPGGGLRVVLTLPRSRPGPEALPGAV